MPQLMSAAERTRSCRRHRPKNNTNHGEKSMRSINAFAVLLLGLGLGAPVQAVHIADLDLDATTLDSSYIGLDLEAGTYRAWKVV